MSELDKFIYESKMFRGEVYEPKKSKSLLFASLFFITILVTGCSASASSKRTEIDSNFTTSEPK